MKISKITIGATIPTQQYGNISPSIEIIDIEDQVKAEKLAMSFINSLYERYSSLGGLKERVVKSSADKINDIL